MVIALRNHEDAFWQTVRAFTMAEKYQIPVILLSDQYLGDSTATIPVPDVASVVPYEPASAEEGAGYARYRYTDSGISPRKFPGTPDGFVAADSDEHDEYGHIVEDSETRIRMMQKRMNKMKLLEEELLEPELLGAEDAKIVLVGWGSLYGPLKEAVEILNREHPDQAAAAVFGDVWPLPQRTIRRLAESGATLVAVEQTYTGQLAALISETTGIQLHHKLLKYDGRQFSAQEIAARVEQEVL